MRTRFVPAKSRLEVMTSPSNFTMARTSDSASTPSEGGDNGSSSRLIGLEQRGYTAFPSREASVLRGWRIILGEGEACRLGFAGRSALCARNSARIEEAFRITKNALARPYFQSGDFQAEVVSSPPQEGNSSKTNRESCHKPFHFGVRFSGIRKQIVSKFVFRQCVSSATGTWE